MHIGFLSPEYVSPRQPEGGLANYTRKVSYALCHRGHRVSVLYLGRQDRAYRDGPVSVREIGQSGLLTMLTKRARCGPLARQLAGALRMCSAVRGTHRVVSFDVVQVSSYKGVGYFLRRGRGFPLVCRVSSYTPLLRSAYGRPRGLGEYLSDWLEVRQVLDADLAFAPSQLMARVYARMECASVEVVRSPFDPPGLVEADSSVYESYLSGKMYLLFFGTLSRVKGADLLGPVASSILARHRDLWFVFVGRDDGLPNHQSVASYVRSCAAGCRDRLMFHTPLPKSQLYPVIAHATGVLMPSRVDNYPNACLEAQALGVPVVGTYGSSLDEMIVDGETGLLADNGDPKAIAHAIERLLAQSTKEARAMRERCLKAAEAARVEDRIGQLVSLYQRAQQQFNAGA